MTSLLSYLIFSGVLLGALFIQQSKVFADPPPWAPAHGYREKSHHHHHKYEYQYYPGQQVYYYPVTQQYFWMQAGNWTVGYKLPNSIQIGGFSPVNVSLDSSKPYLEHNLVKQQYPVK